MDDEISSDGVPEEGAAIVYKYKKLYSDEIEKELKEESHRDVEEILRKDPDAFSWAKLRFPTYTQMKKEERFRKARKKIVLDVETFDKNTLRHYTQTKSAAHRSREKPISLPLQQTASASSD